MLVPLLGILLLCACGSDGAEISTGDDPIGHVEASRFRDPTGDVACVIATEGAQCDVYDPVWEPGPAPEDCVLDWGNGVVLDADGSRPSCSSDSLLGHGEMLAQGTSVVVGDYECVVSEGAVTCESGSGSGFEVSRSRFSPW